MKNNLLSIGDVSKISGVHIKSLRYYDEIGVLKPAYVDPDSNYRYYTYQQLGILDAIRCCIELDIPLKEFESFTESDGTVVHYGSIFSQGKKRAEEKIRSIREGIKRIELFQREIERSMTIQNQNEPTIADLPKRQYYISPIIEQIEERTYYSGFHTMVQEVTQAGYELGYEYGKIAFYNNSGVHQYNFIEIISSKKIKADNVITLPAGYCTVKCVKQSRIQHAPEEFPELFAMNYDKIVVEIELFTENYNVKQPVYELSCSLSDESNQK